MALNTGLRSLSSKLIASVYSSLAKSDSGSTLPLKRVKIVLESGCLPGGLRCLLNGSELSKKVVAYLVFDQLPPIQLFLWLITLTLCFFTQSM
ncbi:hypothetical protein HanXRQr2_Chr05g0214541 [Helianthus annuus]|uniref:Uncharacterized protein n=1 Tax=Helianthus annuus TaxID=4232 RepID=A0A9K3IZ86_HELAN|nr:hypothetical protein HanXRQr2_Chr05g0214541 [Helianthus annuus]